MQILAVGGHLEAVFVEDIRVNRKMCSAHPTMCSLTYEVGAPAFVAVTFLITCHISLMLLMLRWKSFQCLLMSPLCLLEASLQSCFGRWYASLSPDQKGSFSLFFIPQDWCYPEWLHLWRFASLCRHIWSKIFKELYNMLWPIYFHQVWQNTLYANYYIDWCIHSDGLTV